MNIKITFISHATMLFEYSGCKILTDPWLVGDTFWGAWTLSPAPSLFPNEIECDLIVISHWHFDHLNLPTLRQIKDKSIPIFIPKFPISWMLNTLKKIGFNNIIELDHGKSFSLKNNLSLYLYQCQYQDDSIIVFKTDIGSIVNLNDAKPLNRLRHRIISEHNSVIATLRSYSYAWSFPSRFTFINQPQLIVDDEYYIDSFYKESLAFNPQALIGFASGIIHSIKGMEEENDKLVDFSKLINKKNEYCNSSTNLIKGSSGTIVEYSNNKFKISNNQNQNFLTDIKNRNEIKFYKYKGSENLTIAKLKHFYKHTAITRLLLKKDFTLQFVKLNGELILNYNWLKGPSNIPVQTVDIIYKLDERLLNDAIIKNIFTNIDISKLWTVNVISKLNNHFKFTIIYSLYEHGYFYPRFFISKRFLKQWWLRKSELIDYLLLFLKSIILRKNILEIYANKNK